MIRVLAGAGILALAAPSAALLSQGYAPAPATVRSAAVPTAPAIPHAIAVAYAAPLAGPITLRRGFDPPPTPYSAGHRGVDLAASKGQPVLAAADGLVTFAGDVAGRGVLVLAHDDGVRTEYEPVTALVAAGAVVRRGEPIGTLAGEHHGCAPDPCLHWGARLGDRYVDPLTLLRPPGPVRLLPWKTQAAQTAPTAPTAAAQARG